MNVLTLRKVKRVKANGAQKQVCAVIWRNFLDTAATYMSVELQQVERRTSSTGQCLHKGLSVGLCLFVFA